MEVAALPLHFLMLALQEGDGLAAALAALLAARDTSLGLGTVLCRLPVMARIFYRFAFGSDEEHLQTHINARLIAGTRQGRSGHLGARATRIPAVRFPADGDGFRRAVQGPMQPNGDTSNL